jgi:hypothetical protein
MSVKTQPTGDQLAIRKGDAVTYTRGGDGSLLTTSATSNPQQHGSGWSMTVAGVRGLVNVADVHPVRAFAVDEVLAVIERSRLTPADKARLGRLLGVISKSSGCMDGCELRLARVAAGLTYGQAARLVKLHVSELIDMEEGGWVGGPADAPLVIAFDQAYGLAPAKAGQRS